LIVNIKTFVKTFKNVTFRNILFISFLSVLLLLGTTYSQEYFGVEGVVQSRPLIHGDLVIVGTDKNVYAYDLNSSDMAWTFGINAEHLYLINEYVIISGADGITVVDADGNKVRSFSGKSVFTYMNSLYILYPDRVEIYNTDTNLTKMSDLLLSDYGLDGCEQLFVCGADVIVECNGRLVNLNLNKSVDVSTAEELSYIDDKIIQYENYGLKSYSCDLDIINSYSVGGEIIDFGSNKNNIYFTLSDNSLLVMDQSMDRLWKTPIPLVTQASFIDDYYIVGSKENRLYYITSNGSIVFSYSVEEWPNYVTTGNGKLVYVTQNNIVHINDYDLLCYLEEPVQFYIAGNAPLRILARLFSPKAIPVNLTYDNTTIDFEINKTGHGVYVLETIMPMHDKTDGDHFISCVSNNTTLDTIKIFKSGKVLRSLRVKYKPINVVVGDPVVITGYDYEVGYQVPIIIDGYAPGYEVVVSFNSSGRHDLTVKSTGYYDTTITVNVTGRDEYIVYLYYVVFIAFVILLVKGLYRWKLIRNRRIK